MGVEKCGCMEVQSASLFLSFSVLPLNGISLLPLEADAMIKMVVSTTVCTHENMYEKKENHQSSI